MSVNRYFIAFIFILATFSISAQDKPNILWIIADDLSDDLACYGEPEVKTPNIDKLAEQGVRFTNAYATGSVCSASRSAFITGMHQVSVNGQIHRTIEKQNLPEGIKPITEFFREAGYFCTNGNSKNISKWGKTDYNFKYKGMYDGTDWQKRKEGQPFFAQIQCYYPHRPFHRDPEDPIDHNKVRLPSYYPEDSISRMDWTWYLESVQLFDKVVGKYIKRLEEEGELDNTIIFIFGDHGRPHVRDKQFAYDKSLKVPLVVYGPKYMPDGKVDKQLVSLIDISASSLALAGIELPEHMHGKDLLTKKAEKRKYIYGMRDRCGDAVDEIRSIYDGRYHLILNRMPEKPYMQMSGYKKIYYPVYTLMHKMYKEGKLTEEQSLFMRERKPVIELYDLKKDPEEYKNLADCKKYAKKKKELLTELESKLAIWEKDMIRESEELEEKAVKSSQNYYKRGMKKRGLDPGLSDEEHLEYWDKELLKK